MNTQNNDLEEACARARAQDGAAMAFEFRAAREDVERIKWLQNKGRRQVPPIYEVPRPAPAKVRNHIWIPGVLLALVLLILTIVAVCSLPTGKPSPNVIVIDPSHEVRRAEPVAVSQTQAPPVIGRAYTATLPDAWGGAKVQVTYRGVVKEFRDIPPYPEVGDMWASLDTPGQTWIYTIPVGRSRPIWIDP